MEESGKEIMVKRRQYECAECHMKYLQHGSYKKHIEKSHARVSCFCCNTLFPSVASRDAHVYQIASSKQTEKEENKSSQSLDQRNKSLQSSSPLNVSHNDNFSSNVDVSSNMDVSQKDNSSDVLELARVTALVVESLIVQKPTMKKRIPGICIGCNKKKQNDQHRL